MYVRESIFCVECGTTPRSLSVVLDEIDDQKRHRRNHEEDGEYYPDCELAPASPTETARKIAEALDCSGRAKGI